MANFKLNASFVEDDNGRKDWTPYIEFTDDHGEKFIFVSVNSTYDFAAITDLAKSLQASIQSQKMSWNYEVT